MKDLSAKKDGGSAALSFAKVTTGRGRIESFAPEDYTFTAPSNLKSFVFNPLSPTSASNFLSNNNPDETASVSFLDNDRSV